MSFFRFGKSINVIFHKEKAFRAYEWAMCHKYAKTKSEIIKKKLIFLVILNYRSCNFKPLLEKANPTSINIFF